MFECPWKPYPKRSHKGFWSKCSYIWRETVFWCYIESALLYKILPILPLLTLLVVATKKVDMTNLQNIKMRYENQPDVFWRAFESGVNDVLQFERPSTFVIMYKPEYENTLHDILNDLSTYILNKFDNSNKSPIILTDKILNAPPFSEDYGEVIGKYGEELKTTNLMIVENVDKISANVIQAFHVLCDEYTPYVQKAVIIFTVQVEEYPGNPNAFLEELLKKSCHNLSEDIFSPLATRMLGMVLRIEKAEVDFYRVFNPLREVAFLNSVIACGMLLGSVYLLLYYYEDTLRLMKRYVRYRNSIWYILPNVTISDQLFLYFPLAHFQDDLVDFLKKKLKLCRSITLKTVDFRDIERYYKENQDEMENGCIIIIKDIEKVHEQLYSLYRKDENVQNMLKQNKFLIIYTVENKDLVNNELETFLSEEFLRLIPSKKILYDDDW